MKNTKGFYLIEVLIVITLVLIIFSTGGIYLKKIKEKEELRKAKVILIETFTTYSTKALSLNKKYKLKFNYEKKEIEIKDKYFRLIERIYLPKTLKYITIFNKNTQLYFSAKLTNNGNITPSFTIYIFDYKDIARYRVSLYSFELIKHLQINIYKNVGDTDATYENILNFHKNWKKENINWKEE